jgi:mannose-6-phosphate isomerase-like protein (cupin superfamily)
MSATVTAWTGAPPSSAELERMFAEEGLTPHWWGNAPDDTYAWHSHPYHKVLYCGAGSITFHTQDGDFEVRVGDRLDIPPGVEHAATVGQEGCRCIEAPR